MNIIKATHDHIEQILKLLLQVHKVHSDNRDDLFVVNEKKYTKEELKEIIDNDNTPVYVYVKDNKVLGYVFINYLQITSHSLKNIKTMYIDDFCVDKDYKRKGIGSKLFEFTENLAKKEKCYNITLNVYEFNQEAKLFYESLKMKKLKTYMEKIVDYEN